MKIGKRKAMAAIGLVGIGAVSLAGWGIGGTDGLLAVSVAVISIVGATLGWVIARSERIVRRLLVDLRHTQAKLLREQLKNESKNIQRAIARSGHSGEQAEQLLRAVQSGFSRLSLESHEARDEMLSTVMRTLERELGVVGREVETIGREVSIVGREMDLATTRVAAVVEQAKAAALIGEEPYEGLQSALRTEISEHAGVLYRQLEALGALYVDLRPATGLPPTRFWAASPDLLRTLHELVRERRPRLVVECGSGVSTLVMAYAMKEVGGGRIVSLEHTETFKALSEQLLEQHGVADVVSVLHAPLRVTDIDGLEWSWYSTDELPSEEIDILVVDGPPSSEGPQARYPAVALLGDQLAPGGVVVLDDYARKDETEIVRKWMEERPEWSLRVLGHEKGTALLGRKLEKEANGLADPVSHRLGADPSHITLRGMK